MDSFKTWYENYKRNNSPYKKIFGVLFFILGFLALITPLTPGSWLIFVGLELLGFRLAVRDRIKDRIFNEEAKNITMNKIIISLVLVLSITVAVVLGVYKFKQKNTNTPAPIVIINPITPSNISYNIEGKVITLINGTDPISNTKIFSANTQGDVNKDGLDDTVVILTQNSGGSGTFYYVAVAIKSQTGYTGTNAVLMGDRIAPQTSEVKNGLVIVNFADRAINEDFSVSPSIGKSLYLQYFKGTLVSRPEALQLTSPYPYQQIESPLTITGQARGTWFFEASFPVVLVDWDGKIIAQGIAKAEKDWMTENFVPFTATLNFTKPTVNINGSLILKKDNPSGLPTNDASYEIPVIFK